MSKIEKAVVNTVSKLKGGTAQVTYTREDGTSGQADVIAEGWGDGYPSYWPPQVGDEIKIILRPVIIMTRRDPVEAANRVVANQPAWKRNILEQSSRPTRSTPRPPVLNEDTP